MIALRERADFVFVGPSLPRAVVHDILPHAQIHPPIQLGDLFLLDIRPGDRVLIIDGLFLHSPAVRHRELLHLLQQGVIVAGSSSMGALRAAELAPFGMRGFGDVFELYRSGEVTGDDEVAIVHGPAEDGYRALSEPLVNVRLALRSAVADGAIDLVEAAALLHCLAEVPFRDRSYPALRALTACGPMKQAALRFSRWQVEHRRDAKRSDAVTLLTAAAAEDPSLRPVGPDDRPILHVGTSYFHGWRSTFQGVPAGDLWISDRQIASAIALLHPDYPRLHRADVLQRAGRLFAGETTEATAADENDVAATALRLGIIPDGQPDEGPSWQWLAPWEYDLPAPETAGIMVSRLYGTADSDQMGLHCLPPELATDTITTAAVRIVARAVRYARATADSLGLEQADLPTAATKQRALTAGITYKERVVRQVFCRIWDCTDDQLQARAWDCGLVDILTLCELAQPLMPFLRIFGDPGFPVLDDDRGDDLADDRAGNTGEQPAHDIVVAA